MEQSKFYQIKNITEHEYTLVGCDGSVITRPIQDVDKSASSFTIKDAKDGDILLSPATSKGDKECPFIFKEIDDSGIVRFHVALLSSEKLEVSDGIINVMGYAIAGYHIPATKEQRDLLFKKMHEAGYEWDAEKKELKKIEQNFILNEVQPKVKQPKVKLTQLDKNILEAAIAFVEQNNHFNCWRGVDKRTVLSALNSLRPKTTWKPSDEQMVVLNDIIINSHLSNANERVLKGLQEQLKKLREG